MIVTTRGARDAVDALASGVFNAGRNARAYGEVVWSWRRDAGAKLRGEYSAQRRWQKSPLTGESTK